MKKPSSFHTFLLNEIHEQEKRGSQRHTQVVLLSNEIGQPVKHSLFDCISCMYIFTSIY